MDNNPICTNSNKPKDELQRKLDNIFYYDFYLPWEKQYHEGLVFHTLLINGFTMSVGEFKEVGGTLSFDRSCQVQEEKVKEFCETLAKLKGLEFGKNNPVLSCLLKTYGGYQIECKVNAYHSCLFSNEKFILIMTKERGSSEPKPLKLTKDDEETLFKALRERQNILIAGRVGIEKSDFLKCFVETFWFHQEERAKNQLIATIGASPLGLDPNKFNQKAELLVNESFTYKDALVDIPRMNPAYIIVDELKPENIFQFLEMGHLYRKGLVSTIKAGSIDSILTSISLNLIKANKSLNREDLRDLVKSAIDLFVYIDDKGEITIQETSKLPK